MTTTTTSRPHHAVTTTTTTTTTTATRTTRTARSAEPVRPGGTSYGPSVAFLAEVRVQWALATSLYDDAAARGDDAAQQDAVERLEELRELLWHHDLSLGVLRLGVPL
jgi:hypothetical protein